MALGVPGTVVPLGPQARCVDGFPGSLGFPVLNSACSMWCSCFVRTRIEGCFQKGSLRNPTRQQKPDTQTAIKQRGEKNVISPLTSLIEAARMGRSTWPRGWPPTSRRCAEGVQVSDQRERTPHGEPGAKNATAFFVYRLGVGSGAVGAKVAPQLS